MKLHLAVVGGEVSRSLSPAMHAFLCTQLGHECRYDRISLAPERFADVVGRLFAEYDGLNITMPYKRSILPHLSVLCGDAARIGAVNTVRTADASGYNTDGEGFLAMLHGEGVSLKRARVLVLGAGGAARACLSSLSQAGAEVYAASRSLARLHEVHGALGGFTPLTCVEAREYDLIVNCTGAGMAAEELPELHTEGGLRPIGGELLSRCRTAVDLIYEPPCSPFLRLAAACGAQTINGSAMLFYQAYLADCIFLNIAPDPAPAQELWRRYREEGK